MVLQKGCRTRKPEGESRVLGSPTNRAAGQKNREPGERTLREKQEVEPEERTVIDKGTLRSEDPQWRQEHSEAQ